MTKSPTHVAAEAYASRGIAVFPIIPWDAANRTLAERGKAPASEHGLKDATTDLAKIASWYGFNPNLNVGIPTGAKATFVVVDVDGPEGAASLAALELEHGALPETPEQETARGRHICFAFDPERPMRNSASRHPRYGHDPRAKIDVRGEGGYIVAAPSKHASGAHYKWHATRRPSKMPFAPMPEWLRTILEWKPPKLAAVPKAERPASPSPVASSGQLITRYGEAALRDECLKITTSVPGTQENTLNTSAFVIGTLVGGGEINESIARAALVDAGMAIARDWTISDVAQKVERALAAGILEPRKAPEPTRRAAPQRPAPGPAPAAITTQQETPAQIVSLDTGRGYTNDTLWEREIIRKDDAGGVANRLKNAILFLQHHPDMRGVLAFDEFARAVVVKRRPVWEADDGTEWEIRPLRDNDVVWATGWLETKGVAKPAATIHGACLAAAGQNPFNPAVDWLDSLRWDGSKRIETWLTYYMGADDTPYHRTVGMRWLIGAVARVFRPGCKMDTMLILEGPQGLGKSRAARVLGTFGSRSYFTDEISDIGSKDAAMQLQGVAIVEIPELNTFERSDINAIKAWLTRTVDRYRPPYGRAVIEAPRQCVLMGTMNPDGTGYFHDATGARRFWPATITSCDVDTLAADQPQLWAEAVHMFRAGEPWWLNEEEIAPAKSEQDDRYAVDPWADTIDRYIATVMQTRTTDILGDSCLKIPVERHTHGQAKRIGKHLRERGWIRIKEHDPSVGKGKWVFKRPSNIARSVGLFGE